VSQLSENTPKSSRRLQAAKKYLSGDASVPYKSINRGGSLIVEECQNCKMFKRAEYHWKMKNFSSPMRNVTWQTIVSDKIRDFRVLAPCRAKVRTVMQKTGLFLQNGWANHAQTFN
jgi:hypothetical protein